MTLQDVGNLLDSMMADLPSSSDHRKQTAASNLLLDAAEDQASSLPLIVSPSGAASSASQSRKRYQELPRSSDSSPIQPPNTSAKDWAVFSPTSHPFLEPYDVLAFSAATSIKDMAQKGDRIKKLKKKKIK